EDQQRMIQQIGPPARRREVVFADPDQGGFEIGTRGMCRMTWSTLAGRINAAPVKEGEVGTVALHDGIGSAHLLQGGVVKWSSNGYDSTHEGCSCQSNV